MRQPMTKQQLVLHNLDVGSRRIAASVGAPTEPIGFTCVQDQVDSTYAIVKHKFIEAIGGEQALDAYRSEAIKHIMDANGDSEESKHMIEMMHDDEELISLILKIDSMYDNGEPVTSEREEDNA